MSLEDTITAALAGYDELPADVDKVRAQIQTRAAEPHWHSRRPLLIVAAVVAVLAVAVAVPQLLPGRSTHPRRGANPAGQLSYGGHKAPNLATSTRPSSPTSVTTVGTSSGKMPDGLIPPTKRKAAQPFTLPLLRGRGSFSLARLRGQVVVLTWSGSWCAPCRTAYRRTLSAPTLQSQDTTVVTIDTADNRHAALGFFNPNRAKSVIAFDQANTSLHREVGTSGLPVTVVIDRKQRIAAVFYGVTDQNRVELAVKDLRR